MLSPWDFYTCYKPTTMCQNCSSHQYNCCKPRANCCQQEATIAALLLRSNPIPIAFPTFVNNWNIPNPKWLGLRVNNGFWNNNVW
jgi:hypothetical protein